jgi:hypothetical protein
MAGRRIDSPPRSILMLIHQTKIDLKFLDDQEGGQYLHGYVPELGKSGVTIATGFDLGQHREYDLAVSYKLPPALLIKLMPYLGMKGEQANLFLIERPLEISKQEADLIDRNIMDWFCARLMSNYDKSMYRRECPPTIRKFVDLPPGVQTAMYSLVFNMGVNTKKYPRAWHFFNKNWWEWLYKEFYNFGHKMDSLNDRRKREGDLVKPYIEYGNKPTAQYAPEIKGRWTKK